MRLLILGGTRFVGHAIAGAAVSQKWDVTTFNRAGREPTCQVPACSAETGRRLPTRI